MGHRPRDFYDPNLHNVDFASFLDRLNGVEQAVLEFEARLRALEDAIGGLGGEGKGCSQSNHSKPNSTYFCEDCGEIHE